VLGIIDWTNFYKKGTVDSNLYIKSERDNLLIVLVYVDDIIFGYTNESSV
jgi:hypothetical protein